MSRVSEGSTIHAVNFSVGRTKKSLEDLQLQGSNLKKVQKPSDNPIGNMEILSIRSKKIDGEQYTRNSSVAKAQLSFTENAIEELTELIVKAKELAISQASNYFDPAVRKSVAQEVGQLRNQAISIGNRRLGNKYIFSGFKTLTKPFDENGQYMGDNNQTKIEVAKDTFVPLTFSGEDIFFEKDGSHMTSNTPLKGTPFNDLNDRYKLQKEQPQFQEVIPEGEEEQIQINRIPAATPENIASGRAPGSINDARATVFGDLQRLENALLTDNHEIIQDLLPKLDQNIDRLIEVRTKIGSIMNTIDNAVTGIEKNNLINEEYKSRLEDADVAELFSNITRQQNVLNATYKASAQLMNNSLMNFIK